MPYNIKNYAIILLMTMQANENNYLATADMLLIDMSIRNSFEWMSLKTRFPVRH
jgi:hypothetical protein